MVSFQKQKLLGLLVTLVILPSVAAALWFLLHSVSLTSVLGKLSNLKDTSETSKCAQSYILDYFHYPEGSSLDKPNNKFGLYVYAEVEKYFDYADKLVNSNGGDWGYVLIPYNIKDRDSTKWRRVFENLTAHHLIPIVQLWGLDPSKYEKDTKEAAKFLNSFLWPIKERYVSVYNEPNDAKFWGETPDPATYADILDFTITSFKQENESFFMLNGALNASAPDHSGYMSPGVFLTLMDQTIPGIFEKLDGWASHSYPQPNFSGNVSDVGWWSIQAYASELTFLRDKLGVEKTLPVFITETAWAHAEGLKYNASYYPEQRVATFFTQAYTEIWLQDDRVRAVIPFTVYYEPPFDHFSWVRLNGDKYQQFIEVEKLKKVKGDPVKLEQAQMNISGCNHD